MTENNTSSLSLQAQLDAVKAENTKLKAAVKSPLTFKVGEKGGIVVSGIQRFPTTLYIPGWETLLAAKDEILAFCEASREKCEAVTGAKREAQAAAREEKAAAKDKAKGANTLTPPQVAKVNELIGQGIDASAAIKAAKLLA